MKPKPSQSHLQRASLSSPNIPPSRDQSKAFLNGLSSAETTTVAARHILIAQRAYQLYEAQGCRHGHALEHWLKAELEIRSYSELPNERIGEVQ